MFWWLDEEVDRIEAILDLSQTGALDDNTKLTAGTQKELDLILLRYHQTTNSAVHLKNKHQYRTWCPRSALIYAYADRIFTTEREACMIAVEDRVIKDHQRGVRSSYTADGGAAARSIQRHRRKTIDTDWLEMRQYLVSNREMANLYGSQPFEGVSGSLVTHDLGTLASSILPILFLFIYLFLGFLFLSFSVAYVKDPLEGNLLLSMAMATPAIKWSGAWRVVSRKGNLSNSVMERYRTSASPRFRVDKFWRLLTSNSSCSMSSLWDWTSDWSCPFSVDSWPVFPIYTPIEQTEHKRLTKRNECATHHK